MLRSLGEFFFLWCTFETFGVMALIAGEGSLKKREREREIPPPRIGSRRGNRLLIDRRILSGVHLTCGFKSTVCSLQEFF